MTGNFSPNNNLLCLVTAALCVPTIAPKCLWFHTIGALPGFNIISRILRGRDISRPYSYMIFCDRDEAMHMIGHYNKKIKFY